MGKVPTRASDVTIFAELPSGAMSDAEAAELAQGVRLRAYAFDRYKTKRKDEDKPPASRSVTVAVRDAAAARRAFAPLSAVADGVRAGARSGQRAGQRPLSGRIRRPRYRFEESRRQRSRCSTCRP